ncbi:Hypothetical protein D9617_8g051740 [Elsinoe fawcettii]|nr:Hypothetical protein D9617_8g051740 [Elsinoe fawcettii]
MAPDLSFVGLMPQFDMQLWGTEFQMVPAIPKRIMDLPTTLLDYWFASICPMWSVFDSATNQNRMIASGVWAHSEAAYYTLQAMSASYLGDNLPLMRRQLPGLTARACDAINREIISLSSSTTTSESLPSGLLFAIFAMGTSLHWNDPTKLSKWYIAQARAILRRFEASGVDLDLSSQKHASYFRHALVWWTMLHDVVGDSLEDGNETSSRERERASVTAKVHSSSTLGQNLAGPQPVLSQELILHPWTGTSTGIVEQFSLAVRLCHRHVERHKQHAMPTVDGLRAALQDIELAQNLERTLLDTDFVSLHARRSFNGGYLAETGDVLTPIEHLFDTAEATRLAALLHLYETFTDLKIENAIADDLSSLGSATQESPPIKKRHQALSKLALHLLQILRRIPIESRSRSCQILLYMTGAIGLRFDETDPAADQIPPLFPMDAIAVAPPFSIPNSQQPGLDFSLFGQNNALELSEHMLEIAEGRRFITERLNALQGVLPPKPILVALKLVKTIWNEYDEGRPETHWISVMNSSGLRTLFG